MASAFHEGEIEVQERSGVRQMARRVGNGIHAEIPPAAQEFLARQPYIIIGGADEQGSVWASPVFGSPGFIRAADKRTVIIDGMPLPGDPLHSLLLAAGSETPVGLLAIETATRRRMRVNGVASVRPDGSGLTVRVQQVYANCPKYIQARPLEESETAETTGSELLSPAASALNDTQQATIARADTFFIASLHPEGGGDASHRGGNPGFVRVESDKCLIWPDYSGNAMFNTLGNIARSPQAGLLFLNYENGDILQITGSARIVWDAARIAEFAGAERLVEFTVEKVIERRGASPLRSHSVEYSRFNPA